MSKTFFHSPGGIPIVCIGSVWKSWEFLKPGFMGELAENGKSIKSVALQRLKVPMATGACYLGADAAGIDFPKTYSDNTTIFFSGNCQL